MSQPEIINLGSSSPKLSVSTPSDAGTIKLNNLPSLDTSSSIPRKSVNFGPGAEMLMNNKTPRSSSPKSDIKLSELKSLEINESSMSKEAAINLMSSSIPNSKPSILKSSPKSGGIRLNISETNAGKSNLGSATATSDKESTWDGYKKFNEIPINPNLNVPEKPKLSTEETLKKKLIFLRKLEALDKKGVKLTKKYTMDDPLAEMQGEYEMIKSEKEKSNSVKFQGKMLMAAVSAIEFINGKFDPFDIKLDGWGESVSESMEDYDDVFGELHEKYGGKTKMAPEIKLLFMLGGSAAMLHMTNTMFKSSMPGMDDIMKQNPELMQQFTQAAVSSMGQQNPGFGGFMQGVMNNGPQQMPPMGSPPGPPQMQRRPPMPPPMRGRPDIGMARGQPDFRDAENMEGGFSGIAKQPRSQRREMKGPSNIDDLLSGIKTKRVNIQDKSDTKSTISASDLSELKETDLNMPKRSKRKPRSERNTINLNI
tara:strand:- start:2814 stop:4256 length:1443 start_codon:yes stop_codon:yes gene_type:complete